jgi:hypothetical protein
VHSQVVSYRTFTAQSTILKHKQPAARDFGSSPPVSL